MRTPATKFAVPFKSPCVTNSSQTSSSSQPLPARAQCCGESTNHVPPSSDQQRKQKRRCKDILSGLSQDSSISTQTFTTPIAYSPLATQSTTKHSALLSRTHKTCKLSRKDVLLTNAPLLNNVKIVAKQIGKHRRDKSTTSTNVNCTDVIQTGKKEVEAKRKTKHPKDAPIPPSPSTTQNGKIDRAACSTRTAKPTADTVQRGPDVYEFFMSPTSQRKQRQKIRRLQARVSKFSNSVYYSIIRKAETSI